MGIFGNKKKPPSRDDKFHLMEDESIGGKNYQPPSTTFTTNIRVEDIGENENPETSPQKTSPQETAADVEGKPDPWGKTHAETNPPAETSSPTETLVPKSDDASSNWNTKSIPFNITTEGNWDSDDNGIQADAKDESNNYGCCKDESNDYGCCPATESFEIEYDKERFAHLETKRKTFSVNFASFSHRWKSFREDQLANIPARSWRLRRTKRGGDHSSDDGTFSSGTDSSNNSYGYYNDDEDTDDNNSGMYQHFGRLGPCGRRAKRKNHRARGLMEADLDVLAKHPCNEYAQRQFEVWRAASIEGPRMIKITAFVLALVLLVGDVATAIFAHRPNVQYWTPGAVIACCHLVMASLLILLLESRSNLSGKGILGDLVTCGCSGQSVEDDLTENYHATVLPMDAYQEYGDQHYAASNDHVTIAKPRNDVIRNVRLFRYLYGRGLLYVFCGSMAFAAIPGHLLDYKGAVLVLCIPGIALMGLGLLTFFAGVHAAFRWTLLETSIIGGDDHLFDKFLSAGQNMLDESDYDSSCRLTREGFSVLVTTLGLDLDENALIPTVFALEVRPKDPDQMTFAEFLKWWRGKDARRKPNSRRFTSPRSTGSSGKETPSLPSSCNASSNGSLV